MPVERDNDILSDFVMLLGLHPIWRSRMAVRHSDVHRRSEQYYFIEPIRALKVVYITLERPSDWLPVLDVLADLKESETLCMPIVYLECGFIIVTYL